MHNTSTCSNVNFAVTANCVRSLVKATRRIRATKPMCFVAAHILWADASPPEEVIPI